MSISQMQGFAIPSTDDPMETDADRRAGQADIIDIDLDLADELQQDREDEYMGEDVNAFNHQVMVTVQTDAAYNDDEMVDDGNAEQDLVYEASMQDEVLQDAEQIVVVEPDEDDEITDVVDNEPLPASETTDQPFIESAKNKDSVDNSQGDQNFQSGHVQDKESAQYRQYTNHERNNSYDEGDQEPSKDHEPEYLDPQIQALETPEVTAHDSRNDSSLGLNTDGQQQRDSLNPVAPNEVTATLSETNTYSPSDSNKAGDHQPVEGHKAIHDLGAPGDSDKADRDLDLPHVSPTTHHLDHIDPIENNEQASRATAYLHPVIVIYQGAEISLFRPVDGDRDFILEDENFADDTIANLLAGCRPVLGEDVNEQELVIHVNDLDLQICEFSNDASLTTISQLIDMYLQLQHYDDVENPPDFRLRLYTQPSSSHRLEILRNAVEEGKGLSQVKLSGGGHDGDQHSLESQRGKYEDQKARNGVPEPTELDSQRQKSDKDEPTDGKAKSSNVPLGVAVDYERVSHNDLQNTDVQTKSEEVGNITDEVHSKKENLALKENDRHYKQLQLKNIDPATVDAPFESEVQLQQGEEFAFLDDQEDIIDYEDDPTGPESSSGSSTLHGDMGRGDLDPASLVPQNTFQEEVVPETETSSHTLEEPSIDIANHPIHTNEDADELYDGENGNELTKDSSNRARVENLETGVVNLETDEDEERGTFADGEDLSAEIDGNTNSDYRDYEDDGIKGSLNAHQDEFQKHQSENLKEDDVGIDEGDYIEDSVDLDQVETHGQPRLEYLQEDNNHIEAEYDDASGPVNMTENSNATAINEQETYENEASDNADVQALLYANADAEDDDEITYGGKGEDKENESKVSNIERDEMPSLRSLKRSRDNLDADGTTAEDSQGGQEYPNFSSGFGQELTFEPIDAKRTRST